MMAAFLISQQILRHIDVWARFEDGSASTSSKKGKERQQFLGATIVSCTGKNSSQMNRAICSDH